MSDEQKTYIQIWREADDLIIIHIPYIEQDFRLSEEGAMKLWHDLNKALNIKP